MMLADITWTQIGEIGTAVAIVGGFIVTLIMIGKKTPIKVDQDPVPEFRKAAKRYNHDAIENRFGGIERQLAENTSEIETIWTTMRREDQDIREKNGERFEEIARALGRIEGRLGSNPRN